MFGGADSDKIYGSNKWDRMQGGPGNDQLFGYGGRDWLRAGPGDDAVDGGASIDDQHGGNGRDDIQVTTGDIVRGGAGLDLCRLTGEPALLRSCGRNVRETPPPVTQGFQGFVVTKVTADKWGITHMDQINDDPALAALFDTDGDGSANIYGCQLDFICDNVMNSMIAFSGWDNIEQDIGHYDTMFASALNDVNGGRPMLLYIWTPSVHTEQIVPGQNVVWLSVENVLDDSNPLGEDGGESYDQRPGTAPIGPNQCPGAVGVTCQLGWDTWDISAFPDA